MTDNPERGCWFMTLNVRFKGADWIKTVQGLLSLVFDSDKVYELKISEYKERRSLKANNYSWALTDKLAEKMLVAGVKLSKQEMHAEMIYRYGQPDIQGGQTVILMAKSGVPVTDFYPYALEIESGELNGKDYSAWRIYRGSHTYNRAEMNLFIKGIVEECHEQGIETETPDEIARMISLMKEV